MLRTWLGALLVAASFPTLAAPPAAPAEPDPATGAEPARPRLALVLSGGGARGAAHVGVLKVLEEMHIAPDIIVGTSMGSLLGGLYAAGWSTAELEALLRETEWQRLYSDRPRRDEKSFRRKQDDADFLIPVKLRFKGLRPYIPPAVIAAQRLDLFLTTLGLKTTGEQDFDRLPIPFRAVASDIVAGRPVVLAYGNLMRAMRASMAAPVMLPPVEIDGKRLLDGGATANLPIGIAQDVGADAVIAVDITSPLRAKEELESLFSILGQQTAFLTVGNRVRDLERLKAGDVLLTPALEDFSFNDFDRVSEAMEAGENAARTQAAALARFALTPERWAAFQARHRRHPPTDLRVDELRFDNHGPVDDRIVERRVHVEVGQPLDVDALGRDILKLHALDYFGVIQPAFQREPDGNVLTLPTPRKPYGRNSLQFGVSLQDDFQGTSTYSFAVRHQFLGVNRMGGEWQNIGQMGDASLLSTEFYQPLDFKMRWFADPKFSWERINQSVFEDGKPVADFRNSVREGRLDLGCVLGDWGEVRVGAFLADISTELQIGDPIFPEVQERDAGIEASFRVDTLDSVVFPTHGWDAEITYTRSFEAFESDASFERAFGRIGYAFNHGKNVFIPSLEASAILDGPTTLLSSYPLGGFLRLSGLGTTELLGRSGGLGRFLYYRQLWNLGVGSLRTPVYVGTSFETGNVYDDGEPFTFHSLQTGAALFFGANSPLGPVYLAYGIADGGRRRVYLNIGSRF
jgi:NTE family protein